MNDPKKLNDERIIQIYKETSIFGDTVKIGLGLALGVTILGGIWAFIANETGKNIINTWIKYDLFKEEKKTIEAKQKAQIINAVATQIDIQRQIIKQQQINTQRNEIEKQAAWKAWYKQSEMCAQTNINWETAVECANEKIRKKKEFETLYAKGSVNNQEKPR